MTELDWDKLDAQLGKIASRSSNRPRVKFYKVGPGKNKLRVLPPWTNEGQHAGSFWREVVQHWGVGGDNAGPVLCTSKTPGESGQCDVCDLLTSTKASHGKDLEVQRMLHDLRGKTAYLMSIVDLEDPVYTAKDVAEFKSADPDRDPPFAAGDCKVQVYAAPMTVFQAISSQIRNNRVNITDAVKGHNIFIERTGKGMNTKYTVSLELSPSEMPAGAQPVDLSLVMTAHDDLASIIANGPLSDFNNKTPRLESSSAKELKKDASGVGDLTDALNAAIR